MGACQNRNRRANIAQPNINTQLQSQRARGHWVTAIKKVKRLLRLRLYWHYLGQYLQNSGTRNLLLGLERRAGVLHRIRTANAALVVAETAAVAKARARTRARFAQ